ncbi:N-acetylneuraminate lyase [Cyclobacterium xiamenense]|uniref:N-acetylneuraminate lyase n=1 Tax=Cyclobacterium xiamenense TaxID=1297121 RepID=A0A1H7A6G6_9BACT|nr:dihydrodipicolinate synthase family protein [Cyclobacterium xiamenense]SEJ61259.1 N-acetylneuraminate lyase [Cyclobacterium xiamenense]
MHFSKITGLIAATFTPFDKEGRVATELIPRYARFLQKNQIQGVFINGTTGEGSSLTFPEKLMLMEAWAKEQTADFKVIAMLGGTSQEEAVQLGKKAQKWGLYGTAVTAPYYFRPLDVIQLSDYLAPIARAAESLPFYFYHIPLLTRVEPSMLALLEHVAGKIPNFAGIKYTHHNLMEFNQCLRYKAGRWDALWGWDETYLAGLTMGAKGAVGSTYNFAAPLYHAIQQAFDAGRMDEALRLQEKSIDFVDLYGSFGGPAAGKAILKLSGLDCGSFRAPVASLTPAQLHALEGKLAEQGFFDLIGSLSHRL